MRVRHERVGLTRASSTGVSHWVVNVSANGWFAMTIRQRASRIQAENGSFARRTSDKAWVMCAIVGELNSDSR